MTRCLSWIMLTLCLFAAQACERAEEPVPRVCPDCPAGTTCAPGAGECVGCLVDAHCAAGRCDLSSQTCVMCLGDSDCELGVCSPTGVCVGCYTDDHCDGVCHPTRLTCVDCLEDSHCPGGRCHTPTATCAGPCQVDAQCDDDNDCTADRCQDGACTYMARDGEPCDDGLLCTTGDRCEGPLCRGQLDPACCPAAPTCPARATLADLDGDGCHEACLCEGGLRPVGGQCPCPQTITCHGGLVGTDLDGDGCNDLCTHACRDVCDCYAQGLRALVECPTCEGCDALQCVAGACQAACGTPDKATCECPPPPTCGPLETAFDKDGDGCNDACRCLHAASDGGCLCPFSVSCGAGAEAYDSDGDGCDDLCRCAATGAPPGPDGRCCATLTCGLDEAGWDTDADGCDDQCCKALICPLGASPFDLDGDRCPDTCLCDDGAFAPDGGCGCTNPLVCGPDQTAIDRDQDGCVDDCAYTCRTACDCAADKLASERCVSGSRAASACLAGFCASTCDVIASECQTTQGQEPQAVCGCDGATYASPCEAGRAHVDLAGFGLCDAVTCFGGECGGKSRCELPAGVCDATSRSRPGVCVELPTQCLPVYAPVCGCDGVTYVNDCERRRADVGLRAEAPCQLER